MSVRRLPSAIAVAAAAACLPAAGAAQTGSAGFGIACAVSGIEARGRWGAVDLGHGVSAAVPLSACFLDRAATLLFAAARDASAAAPEAPDGLVGMIVPRLAGTGGGAWAAFVHVRGATAQGGDDARGLVFALGGLPAGIGDAPARTWTSGGAQVTVVEVALTDGRVLPWGRIRRMDPAGSVLVEVVPLEPPPADFEAVVDLVAAMVWGQDVPAPSGSLVAPPAPDRPAPSILDPAFWDDLPEWLAVVAGLTSALLGWLGIVVSRILRRAAGEAAARPPVRSMTGSAGTDVRRPGRRLFRPTARTPGPRPTPPVVIERGGSGGPALAAALIVAVAIVAAALLAWRHG